MIDNMYMAGAGCGWAPAGATLGLNGGRIKFQAVRLVWHPAPAPPTDFGTAQGGLLNDGMLFTCLALHLFVYHLLTFSTLSALALI